MPNFPIEPTAPRFYYMNYNVYFRDPADCEAARAAFGGFGTLRRPAYLRDLFGIDETKTGFQADDADRSIVFPYPPTWVDRSIVDGSWLAPKPFQGMIVYPPNPSSPGNAFWYPPTSIKVDYNQDWILIPGHPTLPIWGPGIDQAYIWAATFLTMGGSASNTPSSTPPPEVLPMKKARWFVGFEQTNQATGAAFFNTPEGWAGVQAAFISRDASRTPDGMGLRVRSLTGIIGDYVLTRNGTVTDNRKSWERHYVRIRRYPAVAANGVPIFSYYSSNSSPSVQLRMGTAGQLTVWMQIDGGAPSLVATIATLSLDTWYLLDVFISFYDNIGGTATLADVQVHINHSLAGTANGTISTSPTRFHLQTRIGNGIVGANTLEYDLDDWWNKEHPVLGNSSGSPDQPTTADLVRADYVFGAHMQLAQNISVNSLTNWTGDYRASSQQLPNTGQAALVSTTALALAKVNTEYDGDPLSPIPRATQQGICGWVTGVASSKAGAGALGGVGYDSTITGQIITATQINVGGGIDGFDSLANPGAGLLKPIGPVACGPIVAIYRKSNNTDSETVKSLLTTLCCLGSWGPEDDDPDTASDAPGITQVLGLHNGPYFTSLMALDTPPPWDALMIHGMTYVGNGTGQDIIVPMPAIHFLVTRNVTDGVGGRTTWFTGMIGAHDRVSIGNIYVNEAVRIFANTDGTCTVSIVGTDNNVSGKTYQLTAFCDVSSRVMCNGAFAHEDGTNVNPLWMTDFVPEAAIFWEENVNSAGGLGSPYFKGPGHATNFGTPMGGTAQVANVATFGTGSITSLSAIQTVGANQIAYSAFRQTDGFITPQPIYIGQYTGNGAGGTRNIAVTLGGRRPMFAIVQAVNGGIAAQFRDPSHSGGNSSTFDSGANTANAIVGGDIDIVKVGTQLNTNLIVYNIIVIPGDTVAGNDGWSGNGGFGLTEPGWTEASVPPIYSAPPPIPADVTVVGSGGLVLNSSAPSLVVANLSGLYTIIPGQRHDTILTRNTTTTDETNVAIPEPFGETGYIGG